MANRATPEARAGARLDLCPPPAECLRQVGEEFTSALDSEQHELLRLVGLHNFLSALTVADRQRPAGRIMVDRQRAERVIALISALGPRARRAKRDFQATRSPVDGTFHTGRFVPRNGTADKAALYFGLDWELVEGAEVAEQRGAHELLGRLFGYPDCCSEAFCARFEEGLDLTPTTIRDTGPFPRALNPLLNDLYRLPRLFHFPCSPRCQPSLEIEALHAQYLTSRAPSAPRLLARGTGIACYGPQLGMAQVTHYREIGPRSFEVLRVEADARARAVFREAVAPVRLHVYDAHQFTIGDRVFDDPGSFAAVFVEP